MFSSHVSKLCYSHAQSILISQALIGYIGGNDALRMEKQTDQEIKNDAMKSLRAMFPDIKPPDRVVVTRWQKDESFRGSYSFKTVGRRFSDDSSDLKRKVGMLWFAGEATSGGSWYGSTVGAWKTGEDAGDDMARTIDRWRVFRARKASHKGDTQQ